MIKIRPQRKQMCRWKMRTVHSAAQDFWVRLGEGTDLPKVHLFSIKRRNPAFARKHVFALTVTCCSDIEGYDVSHSLKYCQNVRTGCGLSHYFPQLPTHLSGKLETRMDAVKGRTATVQREAGLSRLQKLTYIRLKNKVEEKQPLVLFHLKHS